MELVGRRGEVAAIDVLLDRVADGNGGLLVLVGPRGSGKTALADVAADGARSRGLGVAQAAVVATPESSSDPGAVCVSLVEDLGITGPAAATQESDDGGFDVQVVARQLLAGSRRVVVIDDVDRAGPLAASVVWALARRVCAGSVGVVVTSAVSFGIPGEHRIARLAERDIALLTDEHRHDVARALWQASRGLPGPALTLATSLRAGSPAGADDPVVQLALGAPTANEFLDVDSSVVALLEDAARLELDPGQRARVLARLAGQLLGDTSATGRRGALIEEAAVLAERAGDDRVTAEVIDARLHAMWGADGLEERRALAETVVACARRAGDTELELRGLFWRFVALMEAARVSDAESALADYGRTVSLVGSPTGELVVVARHAMLAVLRGRLEEAEELIRHVEDTGSALGLADTGGLVGTLRGSVARARGWTDPSEGELAVATLRGYARRLPGHLYEATAARILVDLGRTAEAELELDRVIDRAVELAGTGPRWLGSIADLAVVAHATGRLDAAEALRTVMAPYEGRLVIFGGANSVSGPVGRFLGLLETCLGLTDLAVEHLEAALALEEQIGALPGFVTTADALVRALVARAAPGDDQRAIAVAGRATTIAARLGMPVPSDADRVSSIDGHWSLTRDGQDWLLLAGDEQARLRDRRGLHFLVALLGAPRQEIRALDLASDGGGLVVSDVPVLDDQARTAYRRHLARLTAEIEAADRAGDPARAEQAVAERAALVDELKRAAGLGGRVRNVSSEDERARVNVTRALRSAIEAVSQAAPRCGAHLEASIRTGRSCRYQPADDPPVSWKVSSTTADAD